MISIAGATTGGTNQASIIFSAYVHAQLNRAILAAVFKLYRRKEFLPGFKVRPEHAKHAACHHGYIRSVDPAGRHAFMGAFDDDSDPGRFENSIEAGRNLGGHLLLNLHSLGIDVDQPHQL